MSIEFSIDRVIEILQDYVMFDRDGTEGEEIYVIDYDGQIKKIDTKIRFKVPLVNFSAKFISTMNQIVLDRYESGTSFKMIVNKNERVGFFCIIHI